MSLKAFGKSIDLTKDLGPFEPDVGVLLTSPDGRKQRRVGIDNTGALVLTNTLPFAPDDIAGLEVWLEADQITGLADGDPIATWPDLSSGGNDATQGTAGNRPTWHDAVLNGHPVARFDGINDEMASPASGSLKPFTIVAVLIPSALDNRGYYCSQNGGIELRLNNPTGAPNLDVQSTAGIGTGSSGVTVDTAVLLVATYSDAGAYAFYKNGTGIGGGTNDQSFSAGKTLVVGGRDGGGDNFEGDIAALLAYDTVLSTPNRQAVESYLRTKYGTP